MFFVLFHKPPTQKVVTCTLNKSSKWQIGYICRVFQTHWHCHVCDHRQDTENIVHMPS